MEIREKKSAHQRGSVEWFIDQCGATMPARSVMYMREAKRYMVDGKDVDFEMSSMFLGSDAGIQSAKKKGVITEHVWDHSEQLNTCRKNGTRVFSYHSGMVAVCDGNDIKLVHNFEGLMDMLKEAGYVDTSDGLGKQTDKHPQLGVPGRWDNEKGCSKDFYFQALGDRNFNNELEGAFARKNQLTPEMIKKLRAEFEAAQQMQ